jgi:hypothetical protein
MAKMRIGIVLLILGVALAIGILFAPNSYLDVFRNTFAPRESHTEPMEPASKPEVAMLKLYKRVNGVLHYREAWIRDQTVFEHWGVVGERGETRERKLPTDANPEAVIREVLGPASDAGFKAIDLDDHLTLVIEYSIDGFGTKNELAKRHALEDRMNETLGWTALGHCDGGSTGSGTMDVFCYVVDFDIARRVIISDLQETEFANFVRIYNNSGEP